MFLLSEPVWTITCGLSSSLQVTTFTSPKKPASSQNQLFNLLEFVFLCVTDTVSFTACLWSVRVVKVKQTESQKAYKSENVSSISEGQKYIPSLQYIGISTAKVYAKQNFLKAFYNFWASWFLLSSNSIALKEQRIRYARRVKSTRYRSNI